MTAAHTAIGRLRKVVPALLVAGAACAAAVALLAGPPAGAAEGERRDDRWSAAEKQLLASLTLARLPAAPVDPSNAVAARPEAAALGKRLFFDERLSANGRVACATCHDPARQFQDDRPLGQGVGTGQRRTMPVAGAAHAPWLFWDGRKDSLWSQALGPLEDAAEHGGNRLALVRVLLRHYRPEYEALFGPAPELAGLPDEASPLGSAAQRAAWQAIPAPRRDEVDRAFANLGKSIAAYERTIGYGESRFDAYVRAVLDGDARGREALTPQEVRGLRLFVGRGQCATCHGGPLLTDQAFHNTGVPPRAGRPPDPGRAPATALVQADAFNCLGRHSDAKPEQCGELRFIASDDPAQLGAFKTPSLRNVALRPPYMHAGQFATLEEVVAHYRRSPKAALGHSELALHGGVAHAERMPIRLAPADDADLVAFLRALSGPVVEGRPAASASR